jgi:hypothetical protein
MTMTNIDPTCTDRMYDRLNTFLAELDGECAVKRIRVGIDAAPNDDGVVLFATDEDGKAGPWVRCAIPTDPEAVEDGGEDEVWEAHYLGLVEALDEALTARRQPCTSSDGGWRCTTELIRWLPGGVTRLEATCGLEGDLEVTWYYADGTAEGDTSRVGIGRCQADPGSEWFPALDKMLLDSGYWRVSAWLGDYSAASDWSARCDVVECE